MLEKHDPEASVLLMTRSYVPWECRLDGVVNRDSLEEARKPGTAPSDVFILEGEQIRYGSRDTWQR